MDPILLVAVLEMHLIDPNNNTSLVRYMPGMDLAVTTQADADLLVNGDPPHARYPGPVEGSE